MDPGDQNRDGNLFELCKSAADIRRKIKTHPAEWKFGPWSGADIQFPDVEINGVTVMTAERD
jgi:hypothetical protein